MKILMPSIALLLTLSAACTFPAAMSAPPLPSQGTLPGQTAELQPARTEPAGLSPMLQMRVARASHSATLLASGQVLIAGGFRSEGSAEAAIASAEIYDPQSNTFTLTGSMNEARSGHAAALLPDGQVLIVGGWGENGRTASAELYDPKTGKFRYAASMMAPRASMTITMLKNGLALIAGGDMAKNTPQLAAEIYDPAADTFSAGGVLNQGRSAHTATLLLDGRVLLVGGTQDFGAGSLLASAELYDPAGGIFSLTGSLHSLRYKHGATLLPGGNVLVMGGSNHQDWNGKYASAEIYETRSGRFARIPEMNAARFKLADAVALLDDGNVLIGGGSRQIEIFETQNQRFVVRGEIDDAYYFSVVTRLQDGRALITGGYNASIQPSKKAWIYTP